ncbi:STAS domain-containing protein [Brevibacillus fulvus]|uniref:Anti-sigma factor antagonist n=1 Tax=Brevibacillus fulvus TaxID=1125967 RepID=A0A938Y3B5_9BACL|nr:STAS domain-containing protein [Brevibacillus fulvus]MBM7591584.1 anti-sigma B factor antagonist [Brevibacillus fulvus]
MNFTINCDSQNGHYLFQINGEIDAYTAPRLKERLTSALSDAATKSVTLDFENVTYMDSTGIGVLIGALKMAAKSGCQLKITKVMPRIERILKITGLDKLLPISRERGEST